LFVPLLLVTHYMIFVRLLRRRAYRTLSNQHEAARS
jgi:hypothetical protein